MVYMYYKGHIGDSCCFLCREAVLFSEVQSVLGKYFFGTLTCVLCREVVVVNFYLTREVSSASAGLPESPKTHKRLKLRSTLARKV